MKMPTINLPSTFIASGAPSSNFSAVQYIYVGTVTELGNCIGLLQTANLPTGSPWVSAILQLTVFTKSGSSPSTVNVQKVTSPSPLDVTTVTYSTPVTIDAAIEASHSVAASDIGTTIQIDITSLINSWYTTPFSGLALTCTDGSFILFDSAAATDPATRPQLILTGTTPPVDVKLAGRKVDIEAENVDVLATGPDQTSTPRDISQKRQVSFFVTNTGSIAAAVGVEESVDGVTYFKHPQTNLPAGETIVLSPGYYAQFANLYYHSNDFSQPTTMLIQYIGQT